MLYIPPQLEKPSQNSENEQNSVSLEVLLVKVCHKKRKVEYTDLFNYPARGCYLKCVRHILHS